VWLAHLLRIFISLVCSHTVLPASTADARKPRSSSHARKQDTGPATRGFAEVGAFDYQVTSHLIDEGLVEEGLTVGKALCSRYDGRTRNPWNKYECGNWYACAMASYALPGALSGFRYSAAEKTLWFSCGFGTVALDERVVSIHIVEGELPVEKLLFSDDAARTHLTGA